MKKIIYSIILIASAFLLASCDKGNNKEPDGGGSGDYYEFALNIQKGSFKAGANGVSLNVTALQEKNIIFEAKPGAAVKSYRLDVYPKALLYNFLLEEGCYEASAADCEDKIIELLMSSTTGASKTVFNTSTDDFAAKEFDWANTTITEAVLVPDCDYYIMVLGCYDEEGTNPASLSLCEVTTKSKPLAGDPRINIETIEGHTAFIVKYHPNEDCKYFYHWIWSTEEIGEYIDLFGDRMMRDFCRTYSLCYDASQEENLAIKRTFATASDVMPENTAVAVAVDENLTPSTVLMRKDFKLLQKPEGDFTPKATVKVGARLGATMTYIDVWMDKTCESCFYRVYTKSEAEALKNASAEEQTAECYSLASEGWGVSNINFAYDPDLQVLTGKEFSTSGEVKFELEPETEYVIVSVAENRFGELSSLGFSEPFITKALIRDNPDVCVGDVELTFTEVSRWGVRYNFRYDYSKSMCYRFQIVWPFQPDDPSTDEDDVFIRPPHLSDGQLDFDNREAWLYYLIDAYVEGPAGKRPVANLWLSEPSGFDTLADFGYEAGTEYVVAYCAEDVNGVVGPVHFASFTTTKPNPGPNPTVTIEDYAYDSVTGTISARVKANDDAKSISYFIIGPNDGTVYNECGLPYLAATQRNTYEAYMTMWKSQLIQNGLSTSAESAVVTSYAEATSENPVLIAAVAIGEKNQEDVYSAVAAKIFYKGEFKDLSDFRTPAE